MLDRRQHHDLAVAVLSTTGSGLEAPDRGLRSSRCLNRRAQGEYLKI